MNAFRTGFSAQERPQTIVDECAASLGEMQNAERGLGFLYATDVLGSGLDAILSGLKTRTGIQHWIGSLGSGIVTSGAEHYETAATAVMTAEFPAESFAVIPSITNDSVATFISERRSWLTGEALLFGILHGDPASPALPALLQTLAAEIPAAFFVGGLTSSRGQNFQIADVLGHSGVSGVLFKQDVGIITAHTQGCTPVSKRRVTRSNRNILIELDERPALDVFREDIGELLAKDLNRVAGYIFVGLPIAGSDTGDYLVRNLLAIDPVRKIIAIGDVITEGQDVLICRRDGSTAREDMIAMLAGLKRRLTGPIRGALYYSCLGRGRHQFGEDSEELKLIRDALGDVPLAGFFANGEIFNNRLYGYTGVLSLFV
jgi:small ligand-binding sensory domain FIST